MCPIRCGVEIDPAARRALSPRSTPYAMINSSDGPFGFQRIATLLSLGTTSLISWSCLPRSAGVARDIPVTFPVGFARLATSPLPVSRVLPATTDGLRRCAGVRWKSRCAYRRLTVIVAVLATPL